MFGGLAIGFAQLVKPSGAAKGTARDARQRRRARLHRSA
jgi:hypothetical protein